ncbi:HNH endonuclease [Aliarcobacter cryaerophilus]|uniref:HNH endonuclease n=1 Tax=Aliarcobacter cryaerophilus TaxID=28198 RepID=A0A2S9TMK4_9BACT|nr:HNH endonuclease [Aliarcobacter cryaerophilus]PRN00062.1 HNH endonuclease [Arcobacter cryaerophilus gv. pseudocryaerophilus]
MKIHEKYLEALKTFTDYVTISEWAIKFSEIYPEELQKANEQAINQKNDTTGLREIAARISSNISSGKWLKELSIDESERPRKVKYITRDELIIQEQIEIEEDIEPIRRQDIINNATSKLEIYELYRITEFENIQKSFKQFFNLDFEIDHAEALLNNQKQGEHHPNNLQLLLKYHNGKKNKNSWNRFTFEEQEEYIKKTVALHNLVADKFDVEIDNKILYSLLNRLKAIY